VAVAVVSRLLELGTMVEGLVVIKQMVTLELLTLAVAVAVLEVMVRRLVSLEVLVVLELLFLDTLPISQ
jgi:hypothetical protein